MKQVTVQDLVDWYGADSYISFGVYSCGRSSYFPLEEEDVEYNQEEKTIYIKSDIN